MIAAGDLGPAHYVHGGYLQDWLLKPTDFSWRLEPDKGGASSAVADIGSHWCDLAQHVTGSRVVSVLADLSTVVPTAIVRVRLARRSRAPAEERGEPVQIRSEDLATILDAVRRRRQGRGLGRTGLRRAQERLVARGERRRRSSLRWRQEQQNELWIGRRDEANVVMAKDPALLRPDARAYAHLPGGHQEGWADAFFNVLRDVYAAIAQHPRRTSRRQRLPRSRTATMRRAWSTPCSRVIAAVACGQRCRPRSWWGAFDETGRIHTGIRSPLDRRDDREGAVAAARRGGRTRHGRLAGACAPRRPHGDDRRPLPRDDLSADAGRRRPDDQRALMPRQSAAP